MKLSVCRLYLEQDNSLKEESPVVCQKKIANNSTIRNCSIITETLIGCFSGGLLSVNCLQWNTICLSCFIDFVHGRDNILNIFFGKCMDVYFFYN